MANIKQLVIQDSTTNIFPKTYLNAITDEDSGYSLTDILSIFNMYLIPWQGSIKDTRLYVPDTVRKKGLWITYFNAAGYMYAEYFIGDSIDDTTWGTSSYWVNTKSNIVGDISISAAGTWIVDGVDTGVAATGEQGDPLQIQFNEETGDIEWRYSTTNWTTLINCEDIRGWAATISTEVKTVVGDPGSDPIVENIGDEHDAYFQFTIPAPNTIKVHSTVTGKPETEAIVTNEGTEYEAEFKFVIPRGDKGATGKLEVLGILESESDLPTDAMVSDAYFVGTEAPYTLYIYVDGAWESLGSISETSLTISQETGYSTATVMSQNAVTVELDSLSEAIEANTELIINAHASASLSASPSILEKGSSISTSVTLTGTASFNSSTELITEMSIYSSSTSGTLLATNTTSPVTYTDTITSIRSSSYTFVLAAVIGGVTKTATRTIYAYYPVYTIASADTPTASTITSGTKRSSISSTATGTYSVTTSEGDYIWLCIPSEVTVPSSATMSGFDCPITNEGTVSSVSVNGDSITYTLVRTTNTMKADTLTIIYS